MFAAIGIVPLIAFIYFRPQEYFHSLEAVPLLYLFTGLAAFGLIVDLRVGRARPVMAPQLPWAIALLVWVVISTTIGGTPTVIIPEMIDSAIGFALFAVIAHGAQSIRSVKMVAMTIVVCVLGITAVGVHQGQADHGCVLLDESDMGAMQQGHFDGRPCARAFECYVGPDAKPGGNYACERIGLFGTTTVRGRIRYRGILQDPNELAMAISLALPLLFALATLTRVPVWKIVAAGGFCLSVVALVMTESRMGQLALLAVLSVYFVRRFGPMGLLVGAILVMPAVLMGGRSGAEADESVMYRFESWRAGFDMLKSSPLLGVGKGMFVENNFLTAHNSYVLAAAELGVVGYMLWLGVLYLSVKIPWKALSTIDGPEGHTVRVWAMAIFAGLVGLAVCMLFLSLSYHYVPWIFFGLSGALYAAIHRHRPEWRVGFGLADAGLCFGGGFLLLFVTAAYLRYKGF